MILNNSFLDYENMFDNVKLLTENEIMSILRPGLSGALFARRYDEQKSENGGRKQAPK
jgi:hypothetical protein